MTIRITLKASNITALFLLKLLTYTSLYAYRRTAIRQKAVRLHSFIFFSKDFSQMNRSLENGHIN